MALAARACRQALQDANLRWPLRNRANDGILGDAAHQARKSDHNDGNAFDLTHDPAHRVDCTALSHVVIADRRVTYVIWNRQIYNNERRAEGWRPYTGVNPHNHHMHVSIKSGSRDDTSPWPWSTTGSLGPVPALPRVPYGGMPLHTGSRGAHVLVLQIRLNALGAHGGIDGEFGHGTFQSVQQFQRKQQLKPDGVVGPKTWAALWP
jgi:hypothetical protein